MIRDYKDWIQNRLDELDPELLSSKSASELYDQAAEDYRDYLASLIDAERDRRKYG